MGHSASKDHQKRITRCIQSFQQLQADIRHINIQCANEFARRPSELEREVAKQQREQLRLQKEQQQQQQENNEHKEDDSPAPPSSSSPSSDSAESDLLMLQFRPFTKLTKKSALPWLWRINDNVVIAVTITPKSVVDATIAAASSASSSSSSAQPPRPLPLLPADAPSFTLTIREFYHVFLYMCDNLKAVQTLRDQIMKIEEPDRWHQEQEERRATLLTQRKAAPNGSGDAKNTAVGGALGHTVTDGDDDEKSPSALPPLRQSTIPLECSICLSTPDEEGTGQEFIVLPCLHSFCTQVG